MLGLTLCIAILFGRQQQIVSAQDSTPTAPPSTAAASETAIPTNTPHLSPTATDLPTAASTFIASPAPKPLGGDAETWTPAALQFAAIDHFVFGRPIGADGVNYPARSYAYGSTSSGNFQPHHGDDFENPYGTPVVAAGDGIVEYAGDDISHVFGPQPNFYGNVIVIRHPLTDASGQPVFTLYGHLSQIVVHTGQPVTEGQFIGAVGSAGVALGPHLHFEVRVGNPNDYTATRNPELWLVPFPHTGAIAGRVLSLYGQPLGSVLVQVQNGGYYRSAETYADSGTPGDSTLNENFATSDLAAGYYTVFIRDTASDELLYMNNVLVVPGKITWLGNLYVNLTPAVVNTPAGNAS